MNHGLVCVTLMAYTQRAWCRPPGTLSWQVRVRDLSYGAAESMSTYALLWHSHLERWHDVAKLDHSYYTQWTLDSPDADVTHVQLMDDNLLFYPTPPLFKLLIKKIVMSFFFKYEYHNNLHIIYIYTVYTYTHTKRTVCLSLTTSFSLRSNY